MNRTSIKQIRKVTSVFAGVLTACLMTSVAQAEPPHVANADFDLEASGFVLPAGMSAFDAGMVQQAMMSTPLSPATTPAPFGYVAPGQPVAQVGFFDRGCDSPGCDSPGMSCGETGCAGANCGGCGSGGEGFLARRMAARQKRLSSPCEPILSGGLLGKIHGGYDEMSCGSCAADGQLSGLRHACMFCRGGGCSACQLFNPAVFTSALTYLKPHTEGGLCRQRWYDFSAGAIFLARTTRSAGSDVITQQGAGGFGVPVLFGTQGADGDLEAGVRLSAAFIFGPGGNVEVTYVGGNEWNDSATAASPANLVANPDPLTAGAFPFVVASGADLFSFISDFGTNPIGGFDDTDNSITQTVETEARFHSGEVNYRRRTVGPYCRFQGSWLMGLRYLRYDENLSLDIVGLNNDGTNATLTDGTLRFFNANNQVKNDLFGVQIGGDLWWNMMPGVNLGVEGKLAWLKNEANGSLNISANSIVAGGPGTVTEPLRDEDGTLAGEFQAKLLYRVSHSWTFRAAYYLMAVDELATSRLDAPTINSVVGVGTLSDPGFNFNSLVLNGFSVGAEYSW